MNYKRMFDNMFPGFFNDPDIKKIPEEKIYAELIMDLRKFRPKPSSYPCPDNITFGVYDSDIAKLKEAVGQVDEEWIRYFGRKNRAFCAFDGDTVASFCILEGWGMQDALLVGGPGCVGTVQAYRKRGIGLEMVRQATNLLIEEGFNLSWIHYTHLWHWYEKLGYQTVLKWNCRGFIPVFENRRLSEYTCEDYIKDFELDYLGFDGISKRQGESEKASGNQENQQMMEIKDS